MARPAALRVHTELTKYCFSGDRPLAEKDKAPGPRGKEYVDSAAEADQADPLARSYPVAFSNERHDPPRDKTRDLGEGDLRPVFALDQEMLALIVSLALSRSALRNLPGM